MRLRPQTAAAGAVGFPGGAAVEQRSGASGLALAFERVGRNLSAEQERWLPWCVVAFATGIATYFGMGAEPSPALASGIGAAGLLFAVTAPKRPGILLRFVCVLMAAAALGFAAAK